MATSAIDPFAWVVRLFVYEFIVAHQRPPTSTETATHFRITVQQAEHLYQQLDARHALFLEPGQTAIRMAHPFSGVPTTFLVAAGGHRYYANCAWDALGIPAMLHTDATVEAHYSDTDQPLVLHVTGDRVEGARPLIHFALPFKRWYDNLVYT